MDAWRPMSEAPTDGTPILVKVSNGWKARVVRNVGKCKDNPPCASHAAMETPWAINVRDAGDDWLVDVLPYEPLGWMPIPD